ncbi:MAG: hypothetical protein E7073_04340 [Bacteroidales bacterium]|jgi:uncharacterized protein (TIGR02145 family)|nr:hypothetical protein [Bacteroidales bacterium]
MKKYLLITVYILLLISCKDRKDEEIMIVGEEVDMGLSVKWADRNVGAATSTDYGNYYSWGECSTKDVGKYEWTDYSLWLGIEKGCYRIDNLSNTQYDVANVKWGNGWRMPTRAEFEELLSKCDAKYTSIEGKNGYLFTAENGNSIFLPSAGTCYSTIKNYVGYGGLYWTATPDHSLSKEMFAYALQFGPSKDNKYANLESYNKNCGMSVRPVKDY